jgi:serine/threonine protein kinase
VDIRADLYSLGCTVYFLLTGRVPFDGSQVQKLFQHASAAPPRLVIPGRSTPPALAAVVSRLMAKRPEDRYQTPDAVIRALLALRPGAQRPAPSLGDTPPPAGGLTLVPAALDRADSTTGPKPAVPWWLAVVALALLFAAGFFAAAVLSSVAR